MYSYFKNNIAEYDVLISDLFNLSNNYALTDEFVFCSITVPFDHESQARSLPEDSEIKVRNAIKDCISQISELDEHKHLRIEIEAQLEGLAKNIDTNYEGYGIYLVFDVSEKTLHKAIKPGKPHPAMAYFTAVPLVKCSIPSLYIGSDFKYIDIINNYQNDYNTLVMVVHEDKLNAYTLRQDRIEEFGQVFNDYAKYTEAEAYNDERSPDQMGTHGNRTDKEYTKDYVRKFVQDNIHDFLTRIQDIFDVVVLLYSDRFDDNVKGLIGETEKKFPNVVANREIPDTVEHIKQSALDLTDSLSRKELEAEVAAVLDKQSYEFELNTIIEALIQSKVAKIYISIDYAQSGFVTQDYQPIVQTDDDSVEVDDIAPYIIQATIEQGGEVMIADQSILSKFEKKAGIVAELRY